MFRGPNPRIGAWQRGFRWCTVLIVNLIRPASMIKIEPEQQLAAIERRVQRTLRSLSSVQEQLLVIRGQLADELDEMAQMRRHFAVSRVETRHSDHRLDPNDTGVRAARTAGGGRDDDIDFEALRALAASAGYRMVDADDARPSVEPEVEPVVAPTQAPAAPVVRASPSNLGDLPNPGTIPAAVLDVAVRAGDVNSPSAVHAHIVEHSLMASAPSRNSVNTAMFRMLDRGWLQRPNGRKTGYAAPDAVLQRWVKRTSAAPPEPQPLDFDAAVERIAEMAIEYNARSFSRPQVRAWLSDRLSGAQPPVEAVIRVINTAVEQGKLRRTGSGIYELDERFRARASRYLSARSSDELQAAVKRVSGENPTVEQRPRARPGTVAALIFEHGPALPQPFSPTALQEYLVAQLGEDDAPNRVAINKTLARLVERGQVHKPARAKYQIVTREAASTSDDRTTPRRKGRRRVTTSTPTK